MRFFTGLLILCLFVSPVLAGNHHHLRSRALQTGDPEVIAAVETLGRAGILPVETRNTATDCQIILHEHILQSALARDMLENNLPDRVTEISAAFAPQGIQVSGRIDGPLFINPRFQSLVSLRTPGPNRVDVILHGIQLAGIDIKFLNGMIFRYLKRILADPFRQYITLQDLGPQSDKSAVLRLTIKPEAFVPILGAAGTVTRVFTGSQTLHIHADLR